MTSNISCYHFVIMFSEYSLLSYLYHTQGTVLLARFGAGIIMPENDKIIEKNNNVKTGFFLL